MVQRHKVTVFYTAPTLIRSLMGAGDENVTKYDTSSLRLLGSVGEPINPAAWRWYHETVGGGRCPIVDTYWQTETGGIVLSPLPGAWPQKPGSATMPFFGIAPAVLDPATGVLGGWKAPPKPGKKAQEHGMNSVAIFVKGPGAGRESALRALQAVGFQITSIKDVTPIAHNGCRPPKKRRV